MMAAERTPYRTLPVVERGRERLDNWALWSRLDGSDTGYPRECSYYTPPRTGDTFDEATESETKPPIDAIDAEAVERIIVQMAHISRVAIRVRYIERQPMKAVARALNMYTDNAAKILFEAEARIGRS